MSRGRRRSAGWLAPLVLLAGAGCTQLVTYTDELTDPAKGRTPFTQVPATFGGVVGFAVGIPLDVMALPATWVVYRTQDKETRDPLSIFLFPSFVLWRAGVLLAAPIDAVEYVVWRSWHPRAALSGEELERRERLLDEQEMKGMPVTPLYGDPPRPVRRA